MAQRTTLRDIAERLNITPGTVSKAMNGADDISEEMRSLILDTAVEMGYVNRKAQKKNTRKLCLLIENMEYKTAEDFGYDIVLGFQQVATKEDYLVDLVEVSPDFQKSNPYDSFMLSNGYLGSLAIGFALEDPWMEEFKSTTFPTALLDNTIPGTENVCNISTDSSEAIDLAIEHLISKGHTKIAFLDGSTRSYISNSRMQAYLSSMSRHHLPIDPALAIYGYFVADAAHYHVPNLLSAGATAIICGNDLIASGVIESVKDLGLSVPEDISIIGFDDIPLAAKLDPPLTTIQQDRLALGRSGYFVVHAMLNNVSQSVSLLRPRLIERKTTASSRPRPITADTIIDKDSVLYQNPSLFSGRY